MGKIKINLSNGVSIEKPLVTCFKGTSCSFIVFDNESVGSSGYPIICISKFTGNACEKIVDTNEWSAVKENLKTIIAGTSLPYLSVPDTLIAGEDFFTQLTLPVASFDFLKNAYKPETPAISEPAAPAAPVAVEPVPAVAPEPAPVQPPSIEPVAVAPAPVVVDTPTIVEPVATNVGVPPVETPAIAVQSVITPEVTVPEIPKPVVEVPQIEITQINPTPVEAPVVSSVEASAVSVPINENLTDDLSVLKENFMKSCENMFDALVKKLKK